MKKILIAALILISALAGMSCSGTAGVGAKDTATPSTDQSAPTTAVSPSPVAVSPAAESAGISTDVSVMPSDDKDTIKLEGTIGDIPIHMTLKIIDGAVTGSYYYDKVKRDIRLDGKLEDNRMISFNEYNENGVINGTMNAWYIPGISITGTWTNADMTKTLNLNLDVIDGIPAGAVWSGEWKRVDTGRFDSATLVIFNETKTSVEFQLDAFSGAYMGSVSGTAVISGTAVHFKDKDTSAELTFSLKDGLMDVTSAGDINYYAGMGVGFDGKYAKGAQQEDMNALFELGYVTSQAQDDAFRAMVGKDYELFLDTAQIVTDMEDLDGFGAHVYKWWVRGIALTNASIVMFLPDGKICAGVIDPEFNAIKVYTNADYITEVPKTIKSWSGFTDGMQVEFHSTIKN